MTYTVSSVSHEQLNTVRAIGKDVRADVSRHSGRFAPTFFPINTNFIKSKRKEGITVVFRSPPTIIYGKGTVTSVGEQAARFGKKAVLVCGKGSLRKSGVLDIIVSSLEKAGVSCAVYDRVGSDPTTSDVDEGAALQRKTVAM